MQPSFLRIAVGPIFAFTFYALPLVSETASAETQSTEQEQAEKTAVDHALRDYNDAFGRDDLFAIGQHCNVPFVSIFPEGVGVKVLATMSEIEAFFGDVIRDLRARGYAYSTRSELHVKLLDQTRALASLSLCATRRTARN